MGIPNGVQQNEAEDHGSLYLLPGAVVKWLSLLLAKCLWCSFQCIGTLVLYSLALELILITFPLPSLKGT